MDVDGALHELGLGHEAGWADIRDAHRSAIRASHPDVGGSNERAARLNEAFDTLDRATQTGRTPLPAPQVTPAFVDTDTAATRRPSLVDSDSPTELLMQLADVGHAVGEVVFVDPLSGLLEIIVGDAPGVGQLTVAVGERTSDGVSVAFTLEPLGIATPPPIAEVAADLLSRHRSRPRD